MKRLILCCAAVAALQASALAQTAPPANGIFENFRVFNDFPGTVLAPTNLTDLNGLNQGALSTVTLTETNFPGTGGANRHDFLLSPDSGASVQTFGIDDSFTFSTVVNLAPLNNSPRKEAGIRINSPITGDALFIINSDAGEIVAFGGGTPFHRFDSPGNTYVAGTPITLGITMRAAGDGNGPLANTIEYFIDRGAGLETSGPLAWANLEGGPVNFSMGFYTQAQANTPNEIVTTTFTDIFYSRVAIPEPSTMALGGMAIAALAALRRR